ncbi:hypothetical protein [Hymenobacter koreensis]|uniref:Carboxypeptidase regulatory-like domain-containing protein n=1 Tax=Hymenobacter koreensis TaxID=1084523 RepID=A0ABP8IYM0_9BACT
MPADYEVRGTLSRAQPGTRLVLCRIQAGQFQRLDSARTDAAGRFLLRGAVTPGVYQLRTNPAKPGVLLPLEPGARLQLQADASRLTSATVNGSSAAEAVQLLQAAQRTHDARLQVLMQEWSAKNGQVDYGNGPNPWDQARQALHGTARQVARRFAGTAAAPYAVTTLAGYPENAAFVDSMTTVLERRQPQSLDTEVLLARRKALRATAVGAMAPDIRLNTPEGQPVALSSLRGNYVLLGFLGLVVQALPAGKPGAGEAAPAVPRPRV